MRDRIKMSGKHSLDELRQKAHKINCELTEEGLTAREIEIIGYYLNRIAASYLSYFTHKEFRRTEEEQDIILSESKPRIKEI